MDTAQIQEEERAKLEAQQKEVRDKERLDRERLEQVAVDAREEADKLNQK